MSAINCKVQLGQSNNFHRFAVAADAGFEALQAKLLAVAKRIPHWEDRLATGVVITYKDDEGDQVTLADDADLAVALGFGDPLRLTIRPRGPSGPNAAAAGGRQQAHVHMHGGGGGWHRWAVQKYGCAPARRLAATAGIDHQMAVAKFQAAMRGDAEARKMVDVTMSKAAPAPMRGRGHHGHRHGRCHMGQKLFSCRAGPAHKVAQALGIELDAAWALLKQASAGDEAAQQKVGAVLGELKASFGQKAAAALGVQPDEAWDILAQAKHGDPAAQQRVGAAMKSAWAAHKTAAAATAKADANTAASPAAPVAEPPQPPAAAAAFPEHWGPVPAIQTEDIVALPAGFGSGSSTLARWIADKLAAQDAAAAATQAAEADAAAAKQAALAAADARRQAHAESIAAAAAATAAPESVPFAFPEALKMLTENMGFPEDAAREALLTHRGSPQLAVAELIG